jgi:tetratricopeptide (TPR) repeat protein
MRQAIARALQIAFQLEQQGDQEGAKQRYEQILRADPRQPDALNRLGVMAGKTKDYQTSARYFAEAVKVEPKNAPLRGNLAVAYLRANDLDNALIHLKKALSLDKRSVIALYNLADCYSQLEKPQEAIEHVDRLLKLVPDHKRGHLLRARVLASLGRMDEAEAIYRDFINRGVKRAAAYRGLSSIRKYKEEPPELADVETLLEDEDLSRNDKSMLHFAAGKFADDCGQHDRAFRHFIAGKGCYEHKFDIVAYTELVQGMKEIMTPDFFAERGDFANPSDRPVLVYGMPRSGTTLTEQIIGSHPRARPAGELTYFAMSMRDFGFNRQDPDLFLRKVGSMSRAEAARIAEGYLAVLRKHSRSADRVVDKMPHNFEQVWLIALLFPNASFIHACRDPMDNCISCFTNPLNEAHNYTGSLQTLGRYYRLYDELTRHWYDAAPVEIMRSQYEEMTADQEAHSRKLIAHTGLEWDDACLRYYESDASVRTLSRWQVRQPVYKSSVARWKKYDAHLDPLKEALGDLYKEP